MRNVSSTQLDIGLKRLEGVLRWRGVSVSATGDDVNGRIARMRAGLGQMQHALVDACSDADRALAVGRDTLVRALGDLLKAQKAEDVSIAETEIRHQLYEIAAAQADAWALIAEKFRVPRDQSRPVVRDDGQPRPQLSPPL